MWRAKDKRHRRGRGVISLHDVTVAWEDRIEEIVELVQRRTGLCPALLIVPNFHDEHPVLERNDFVEKLSLWRSKGAEVLLHGLTHKDTVGKYPWTNPRKKACAKFLTNGEGEFLGLGRAESKKRVREGKKAFIEMFGEPPRGFVAPAWLSNSSLPSVLEEEGFDFYEGHIFVHQLSQRKSKFCPALTFSGRDLVRAKLSRVWAKVAKFTCGAADFRLALHPGDWDSKELSEELDSLMEYLNYKVEWVSYEEMLRRT